MIIEGIYGGWFDEVRIDGKRLDPARSLAVYNHSPDGFAWGYSGSGPAQLALAILLYAGAAENVALASRGEFLTDYIARLPQHKDFRLEVDVQKWLDVSIEKRRARIAARVPGHEQAR